MVSGPLREMREARTSHNDSEDYILSGGRLPGVENITAKFLLALVFVGIGMYAGPNPRANQSLGGVTWLPVLASLVASYGILLCGDLVAK